MPETTCNYFKKTSNDYFQYSDNTSYGYAVISEGDSCEAFNQDITQLLFKENSCNDDDMNEIYMSGYSSLEKILVESNTFKNTYTAIFVDMNNLISITFKKDCFSGGYKNSPSFMDDSILVITNCSSLTTLVFEERSFISFRHFNLTGMHSFTYIHVA